MHLTSYLLLLSIERAPPPSAESRVLCGRFRLRQLCGAESGGCNRYVPHVSAANLSHMQLCPLWAQSQWDTRAPCLILAYPYYNHALRHPEVLICSLILMHVAPLRPSWSRHSLSDGPKKPMRMLIHVRATPFNNKQRDCIEYRREMFRMQLMCLNSPPLEHQPSQLCC